jgi:uncharacterized protein (TIGR02271 family)
MISSNNAAALIGGTVVDNDGNKIGSVGQLYVDPTSGQPNWVTVKTGLFGTSETFVPLEQADAEDETIRVPYEKAFVKDAPRIDADGPLQPDDEQRLYDYYRLGGEHRDAAYDAAAADTRPDATIDDVHAGPDASVFESSAGSSAEAGTETTGHDTSGPTTDDAMTRSEERLHVGTERVETGRARLRKYIVTENETVTVPVSHEEVRIEREPITDANVDAATSGPDLSEEEHEVVLTGERPVVEKETVPVERVRLDTETVTENETVDEGVRKEQIDYVDDAKSDER